jgi:hypothetical protein
MWKAGIEKGWAGWGTVAFALILFANPILYNVHLIIEPHIYCPVHGQFESRVDPATGEPWPGEPADPREHHGADVACLLTHLACGAEEGQDHTPAVVSWTSEWLAFPPQQTPAATTEVLALAPKQSPPAVLAPR